LDKYIIIGLRRCLSHNSGETGEVRLSSCDHFPKQKQGKTRKNTGVCVAKRVLCQEYRLVRGSEAGVGSGRMRGCLVYIAAHRIDLSVVLLLLSIHVGEAKQERSLLREIQSAEMGKETGKTRGSYLPWDLQV
jgi:hypothetical protein